jgi:hypothetical protein
MTRNDLPNSVGTRISAPSRYDDSTTGTWEMRGRLPKAARRARRSQERESTFRVHYCSTTRRATRARPILAALPLRHLMSVCRRVRTTHPTHAGCQIHFPARFSRRFQGAILKGQVSRTNRQAPLEVTQAHTSPQLTHHPETPFTAANLGIAGEAARRKQEVTLADEPRPAPQHPTVIAGFVFILTPFPRIPSQILALPGSVP